MKRALLTLLVCPFVFGIDLAAADSQPAPDKPAGPKVVLTETFQVRNKKFGELLRPEDANSADGTRIVLYSPQKWKCLTWRFHPAGESTFQLQNLYTSKTFAAEGAADAAPPAVKQVPFGKDAAERPAWTVSKLPDGSYKILDPKSGKALTAAKSQGTTVVVLDSWAEKDEQKWELLKTDPNSLTM